MENSFPEYDFESYRKKRGLFGKLGRRKHPIQLYLFLLTVLSTYWVQRSLWYTLSIIIILLTHEMGHYLMCKKHGIDATLPYFIPMPFAIFGTMGAVIKMESRIPNRKALFDVGVAGPLAGLAFTIPAIIVGLKMSRVIPLSTLPPGSSFSLGESLLFKFISRSVIGDIAEGYDVILHPLAFAGWAGMFVTALNLLPIGQLDGGHVSYAILGKKSEVVFKVAFIIFIAICIFLSILWFPLIVLLMFFRLRHPPTMDDSEPLDEPRRWIGLLMLVIFVLSFIPVPFLEVKGLLSYFFLR